MVAIATTVTLQSLPSFPQIVFVAGTEPACEDHADQTAGVVVFDLTGSHPDQVETDTLVGLTEVIPFQLAHVEP